MIWLALIFMTHFFLEPEKVLVGSKIVTSIFCQSSMSPDHSGVGVQFIHISHTNSKSQTNPTSPKHYPKPPLLNQFIKKFHLRKLSLIISSITASIICDLLKQLLQWSQLTLTQLVRRLYYSKRWKICKPFPVRNVVKRAAVMYICKNLQSHVLNFKAMIVQGDTQTIKWNTEKSIVQAIMNLRCSRP